MKRLPTIFSILCAVAVSLMVADTASAAGRGRRGQSCDCASGCAAEPACCAAEPACAAAEPACCAAESTCCESKPAHRRARQGRLANRRANKGGCASCCEEPACSAEPCCNAG